MHAQKKLTSFIMTYACATVETYKFFIFKYGYLQLYAGSSLYPWPLATPIYFRLNIHVGVHRYMPTDFCVT